MKIIGLEVFEEAYKEFEANGWAIHSKHHFKPADRPEDFDLQMKAQVLAEDIGFTCMVFKDLYLECVEKIQEATKVMLAKNKVVSSESAKEYHEGIAIPVSKVAVIAKYFFILIRAYQDAIYKMMMRIFKQGINDGTSVAQAIDQASCEFILKNPVAKLLDEKMSTYAKWFLDFRKWRNLVKTGQGATHSSGQDFEKNEIRVSIELSQRAKEGKYEITLLELAKALKISASLTTVAIELGLNKSVFTKQNFFE